MSAPPGFNATISGDVVVENGGEIRLASASPSASTLTVAGSLALSDGVLSGKGRILVQGSTIIVSSLGSNATASEQDNYFLGNGIVLDMAGGGEWNGGNVPIYGAFGVINRGTFTVTADGGPIFGVGEHFVRVNIANRETSVSSNGTTCVYPNLLPLTMPPLSAPQQPTPCALTGV